MGKSALGPAIKAGSPNYVAQFMDFEEIGYPRIGKIQRIRYAAPRRVPQAVLAAAATTGFYIVRSPVLMEGRIEMLHYIVNQSICDDYHRYGNLGDRAL